MGRKNVRNAAMCLGAAAFPAYTIVLGFTKSYKPTEWSWYFVLTLCFLFAVLFCYFAVLLYGYKFEISRRAMRQSYTFSSEVVRYRDVVKIDDVSQNFHVAVWYVRSHDRAGKLQMIKVTVPIGKDREALRWLWATLQYHANRNQEAMAKS